MQILIKVKLKPRAKREYVKQISKDEFEVTVSEPPEMGKANEKVLELLSKYFKVFKSSISIIKGKTSRMKLVMVKGHI